MQARPFRSLPALCLSLAALVGLASSAFAAGPKDKAALKLHDSAMNEDYLNVEFPKAEKKLKDALKACGASGCSPAVVAKIHVSLGTVYGVGMSKMDQAKTEFKAAIKADSGAALDKSLATPELQKAFDETKGGGSKGEDGEKPTKKAPGGDLPHTPTTESGVNSPVPVYIDVPSDLGASKVTLRYKPFGGTAWKSVTMAKAGDGYGAEIPCDDTTTTGEIKYYITVSDDGGSPVAQAGTLKEPYRVTIKNELEGEAPHLPGKPPPKQCAAKGECPPGLPGCPEAGAKPTGKGDGATCESNSDCASSNCLNGTCVGDAPAASSGKTKRNVVGAYIQFDLTLLGSKAPSTPSTNGDGVCSVNSSGSYACFETGTTHQFFGAPDDTVSNTDSIAGGFAFAGIRALIGFDRQLSAKLPLSVGIRFGVAPGGIPNPDNTPLHKSKDDLGWAPVPGFPPIHAEARLMYSFGGALYEQGKFHPFVFIGGGAGRVGAAVSVKVCDQLSETGNFNPKATGGCPKSAKNPGRELDLDAYQIEGLGFVAPGVGFNYGITDHFGLAAELKVMFMLPTFGIVLSPTLGPIVAF